MYHALLTNRYLSSRIIPLIAVAAVALCVALVIIVVSVMTGFLDMLRDSGRKLTGDVVISYPIRGIPYYDRLLDRVRALPEVEAATPMIETFGLIRMPYPDGDNKDIGTVQVWGVDPESFDSVTDFNEALYWSRPSADLIPTLRPDDRRLTLDGTTEAEGRALREESSGRSGIVLGMHVSQGNKRAFDGSYEVRGGGFWWMPRHEVALTLVPISGGGKIAEPREVIFPVVNEFYSGVYQVDKQRVMIPLAEAQEMLRMTEATIVDPTGALDADGRPKPLGVDPAKVTKILVRAAEGVDPDDLRLRVEEAYAAFAVELDEDASAMVKPPMPAWVSILTWEQMLKDLIAPVEKEREMMRILFSIIYLVCAGLVLSIFWAIVHEKTRDIGILRSIGAARTGILWIFLRYGLIIGCAGSVVGLGLAWLVVRNINDIHTAVGEDAPTWLWASTLVVAGLVAIVTVRQMVRQALLSTLLGCLATVALVMLGVGLMLHQGTLIWDPSVYYFSVIPNEVDLFTAGLTMVGAVIFSLIGASIPAAKAADIEPVRALRFE